MIARIVIPLILVIVLSDLYIDVHYFRRRYSITWWMRLLWWIPCIGLSAYTISLASQKNFAPSDITWLYTYLLLLGFFVGPKAIFAICSFIGSCCIRLFNRPCFNPGHYLGIVLGIMAFGTYVYGLTFGLSQIRVTHTTLYFDNLPQAFDGYRILHVSDLHIGSFTNWRKQILKAEMDSIRKQQADLMVFTGDLQNMRPREVIPYVPILTSTMRGTISILGNHDYARYVKVSPEEDKRMKRELISIEREKLEWTPLVEEHIIIRRGNDSIVIAGEEDKGKSPYPNYAGSAKLMKSISPNAFLIMLQHNPAAWKTSVLPLTSAQLTLSGHTHGGQMQLFGLRPTMIGGQPDKGLYEENGRYLYVNAGLGGLIPFRLNMPNEITLITLRSKRRSSNNTINRAGHKRQQTTHNK